MKFCILVTKNCLEIENVIKFESLEACKGKNYLKKKNLVALFSTIFVADGVINTFKHR